MACTLPFGIGNAEAEGDRKSTRLNSSHGYISYAVFCLKKKKKLINKSLTIYPWNLTHTYNMGYVHSRAFLYSSIHRLNRLAEIGKIRDRALPVSIQSSH